MAKFLRKKPRTIREVLEEAGVAPESIEKAEQAGTDQLLAIDVVVLPEKSKFTVDELADKVGVDVEVLQMFWRALGFVDPVDEERPFNKRDAKILRSLVALARDDLIDTEVALQVARVIGLSVAQIATAIVDASEARSEELRDVVADGGADALARYDDGSFALRASELLPFMSEVVDYSFRRHLRAAARRRVALNSSVGGANQVIGFADLVRFTELSLHLGDRELAQVVGRFDELVHRVVVRHGGRVVKMIGDGAMFSVVRPVAAAEIALELLDASAADDHLPGLRIGMARGQALARDGDLYGPVVNLASRLATFGRSGVVNVDQAVRDAIAGDGRFALRSLGQRNLRHIGDLRVYRLRPGPEWQPVG